MAELGDLADEEGADTEAHHEQSAAPVQQVQLVLHLIAVRIDSRDRDNPDETVEGVKLRKFELVFVHQNHTQNNLNKHGQFGKQRKPPQRSGTQRLNLVSTQRPQTSQAVRNDHKPGPRRVEISQHQSIHASLTLVAQTSGRTGDATGHGHHNTVRRIITQRSRQSAVDLKAHSQDVVIEDLGSRVHIQNLGHG